jgi:hypothetical protein
MWLIKDLIGRRQRDRESYYWSGRVRVASQPGPSSAFFNVTDPL